MKPLNEATGYESLTNRLSEASEIMKNVKDNDIEAIDLMTLAKRHNNNFIDGSFDLFNLAFVEGMKYQERKAQV